MSAADPWVVTMRERTKYQEQFNAIKPVNDIVTGQQARGFFLQSQLPPQILGEIWWVWPLFDLEITEFALLKDGRFR